MVQRVTFVSVRPSKSRMVFSSESSTSRSPACLTKFSSINESSAPESASRDRGKDSCAHNKVPGRLTRYEDRQDKIALASAPCGFLLPRPKLNSILLPSENLAGP